MATGRSELMRLFVAIELPAELRETLTALQADLRRRGLDSLRWVRPDGIHLTLKFLGEVPSNKLPTIRQALAGSVKGVPLHRLSVGPLGTFGNRRGPQVLWVDLKGDLEPLLLLQERVERALEAAGFPRERRQFAPHLTLARVRPEAAPAMAARLAEAIQAVRVPPGELKVREVSLMRSILQKGGTVYQCLATFPLE